MKKIVSILMMAIMLFICGFTLTEANAATKVTLNKKTVTVRVGCNTKLRLKNATSTVTWKSADESIAKVSTKGTVTGIKKGTTKISATYKKKTYKCTVTVNSSRISVKKRVLPVGHSYQLWVLKRAQKGEDKVNDLRVAATVKWKSSNSKIVKVNKNGLVMAKKEGTAEITAKVKGETYTCTISVVKPLGYDDFAYNPEDEMAETYRDYGKYDWSDTAKKYSHFSGLLHIDGNWCRDYTKIADNDENRGIVIGDTIEDVREKFGETDGKVNQKADEITNFEYCSSTDPYRDYDRIACKMTYTYKYVSQSNIIYYEKIFYFDENDSLILIEWRMGKD